MILFTHFATRTIRNLHIFNVAYQQIHPVITSPFISSLVRISTHAQGNTALLGNENFQLGCLLWPSPSRSCTGVAGWFQVSLAVPVRASLQSPTLVTSHSCLRSPSGPWFPHLLPALPVLISWSQLNSTTLPLSVNQGC